MLEWVTEKMKLERGEKLETPILVEPVRVRPILYRSASKTLTLMVMPKYQLAGDRHQTGLIEGDVVCWSY